MGLLLSVIHILFKKCEYYVHKLYIQFKKSV